MSAGKVMVSTAWLRSQLTKPVKNLHLLDVSWDPIKGGHGIYLKQHIPGASFFDLNIGVQSTPTIPLSLPEAKTFQSYVQSFGINNESHLVFYDRGEYWYSARAWGVFRAYGHSGQLSVLDGGFKKWEQEGYDVTSGEGAPTDHPSGNFEANINQSLIKDYDKIKEMIQSGSSQIIDGRLAKNFHGEEEEPSFFTTVALQGKKQPMPEVIRRGHIPGSVSIPVDNLYDPATGCFYEVDDLKKLFKDRSVDLQKPLTASCYIGFSAAMLSMAAFMCGKPDVSVYYGSWTEYGQRAPEDFVEGPPKSSI